MSLKLDKIFDSIKENTIFKDKNVLQTNYSPETILHREDQINQIASILAPVLRGERTSNLFLYGNTGTGKTLSIQYVRSELLKRAMIMNSGKGENKVKLRIEYLNCKLRKVSDTEYRILAELIKQLGGEVPMTGLPTEAVYTRFVELVEKEKQVMILIFDEIDQAVKKISDNFLYTLTRLNSDLKNAQICLIGISNDLTFLEGLDPRVKSSLSEEELIFPPYNAVELQNILKYRAEKAFHKGVLDEGVVSKCAAFAAREHGDARRALDLLRVAGELCERENSKKIAFKHIDMANEKIERDKVLDIIQTHPKQFQSVLFAIISLTEKNEGSFFTGDVYNKYQDLCKEFKMDFLTQRRVGDILQEFDMLGLINASVISKGRKGRMREIKLLIPKRVVEKAKDIILNSLKYN